MTRMSLSFLQNYAIIYNQCFMMRFVIPLVLLFICQILMSGGDSGLVNKVSNPGAANKIQLSKEEHSKREQSTRWPSKRKIKKGPVPHKNQRCLECKRCDPNPCMCYLGKKSNCE